MSLDLPGSGPRAALATLQGRITAVAMLTAVAVLLAACAVFTAEQWRAERQGFEHAQEEWGHVMAVSAGHALQDHDLPRLYRELLTFSATNNVRRAEVLDPRGRVISAFASSHPPLRRNPFLVATRTPVYVAGRQAGEFVLVREQEMAGQFLLRCLAVAAALFFAAAGLSLFLGRWLAKRVVEPIDRLSEGMREVGQTSDFARRVEPMADDELGRLTECFNALIERLQANDRELRDTLQELTHARDAAEAANVQKSQFLANMSHEIRTPLNGVLAMAQIMALGDMATEQRERLSVIRKSGEALLEVLNDILDVSKIEAGKLELDPIEFDVERVMLGASDSLAGVAEKKGLELGVEITSDARGVRLGDPARLRQIVTNLVSNALKFTNAGKVIVTARGMGDAGADGLWISVSDTGIGIPADKLPMLFQKFTQLDPSTTRKFGGTGLGLAICHDLAALMGGRIWAESVEGQGSTFHVELPLTRVVAGPGFGGENDDVLPEDQGRVLRVLAAEDNLTNQMVLTTIIQIFGAELELAANGAIAVEAWDRGEFDVILMDIQMPVMDGISATREIRRREAAQSRTRTPIVALSANALVHQIREYLAAGMDGHVAKPIELPKLHAALENALNARMAAESRAA